MAILFDDASSEYAEVDNPPVTAAPFTMGCFFQSDSIALPQVIMSIVTKASSSAFWLLLAQGDAGGDPIRFTVNDGGGNAIAATSSGYSANTWHHVCAVETSAASRAVYIDGGSKGTNTTSRAPLLSDRFSIARYGGATPSSYLSGRTAEPFVYNIALSDAEVALLALGISPLMVRPEALVFYMPMLALGGGGTQLDWIGGRTLTETNTPTTAAHPLNIFYPSFLTTGYGIATAGSALSLVLNFRGDMDAIPLSAEYEVFASSVPRSTFTSRD